MMFFTLAEFQQKYREYAQVDIPGYKVEEASEMIFSQCSLRKRSSNWDTTTVPECIKRASMEQLRFMMEHDIPFVDFNKKLKAGSMEADLNTDYSTYALRILGNNGYLYRGSRIQDNMGLNIPYGG